MTAKTNKNTKNKSIEIPDYDKVPYESNPFENTRPEVMHTIASLFGAEPAKIDTARVLEMGCASGNNMINFALSYPKSKNIAIDTAKAEIEKGQAKVDSLGIKNLELKVESITDLDESYGKFDYIICHGILSWVPEPVQEAIFSSIKKLLAPAGVALVSYNALPGWNMTRTIRDMLRFHTAGFESEQDKIKQARLLMDFMVESLEGNKTPYADFIRQSRENIRNHSDYYLFHEYMGDHNTQFYFEDIAELARKNELSYMGEVALHSMFLGNLPKLAAEKLSGIDDIVRTEQYMDFIKNRKFRSTLLCHEDVKINRKIDPKAIANFYTSATITINDGQDFSDKILRDPKEKMSFTAHIAGKVRLDTSSPVMKCALCYYSQNTGRYVEFSEILHFIQSKLKSAKKSDITQELLENMVHMIFSGHIKIRSVRYNFKDEVEENPKISTQARYEAQFEKNGRLLLTNQVNKLVAFEPYEICILEKMDGKNSLKVLKSTLEEKIKSGDITMSSPSNKDSSKPEISEVAEAALARCIEKLRYNHFLI